MMALPRSLLKATAPSGPPTFGDRPLQKGLGGCPWRVTVASVLLNRTRRAVAQHVLERLLRRWPTAADLARSDTEELTEALRPCGLQRARARRLQRLSSLWLGDSWQDLRELPGVGKYVADAVGLICFGCTELETDDAALVKHVKELQRETVPRPAASDTGARHPEAPNES